MNGSGLEEPVSWTLWGSPHHHYLEESTALEEPRCLEKPAPAPSWWCLAVA
jgi:hypothetical protein